MENEMFELSDKYLEVRNQKQDAEAKLKDISKQLEDIENELIQRMTDCELNNFKRNGVLFSVVTRQNESANPETRETLYTELKSRGYENLFTVNANTLGGLVREMKKENEGLLPEWLDGLINTYEKQTIRIKKD